MPRCNNPMHRQPHLDLALLTTCRLKELKELISSYQSMRDSGRAPAVCASIIETARQCNLDKDVQLPEEDPKDLSIDDRDLIVGESSLREGARRFVMMSHCSAGLMSVGPSTLSALALHPAAHVPCPPACTALRRQRVPQADGD